MSSLVPHSPPPPAPPTLPPRSLRRMARPSSDGSLKGRALYLHPRLNIFMFTIRAHLRSDFHLTKTSAFASPPTTLTRPWDARVERRAATRGQREGGRGVVRPGPAAYAESDPGADPGADPDSGAGSGAGPGPCPPRGMLPLWLARTLGQGLCQWYPGAGPLSRRFRRGLVPGGVQYRG